MLIIKRILFVVVLFWASFSLYAQDAGDRLSSLLEGMNAYSAGFEQTTHDAQGVIKQRGQGNFVLEQPGRFRWVVNEPFPQTIVSDGKSVWVYDPDLEQVSIDFLDERASKTPAVLLSGSAEEIRKHYRISNSRDTLKEMFILSPKDEGSLFTMLVLNFVDDKLVEMQIEDSLGQFTKIAFTDVTLNPSLDSDTFSVSFPDYVDVLDNRQTAAE
ncbi:outer membrane lipoprotein chaperone LolA [Litoribrevibacter euphylliae]|uniref:Outer-membrane lipoprotein carrier protein n=1 Tax=Litoribrevibacter euphylliae TaxID=1834034 RepID=A0ABV7HFX8_9GAMM